MCRIAPAAQRRIGQRAQRPRALGVVIVPRRVAADPGLAGGAFPEAALGQLGPMRIQASTRHQRRSGTAVGADRRRGHRRVNDCSSRSLLSAWQPTAGSVILDAHTAWVARWPPFCHGLQTTGCRPKASITLHDHARAARRRVNCRLKWSRPSGAAATWGMRPAPSCPAASRPWMPNYRAPAGRRGR